MVGSRKLDRLLQVATKARAKVILLGDAKQIQPIAAGQIFGAMHMRFGSEELRTVVRQEHEEAQVLLQLRDETSKEHFNGVLSYLEKNKRLCLEEDSRSTIASLIGDWQRFRMEKPNSTSLIIASRNETVDRLNRGVRSHLKK